MSKRKQNKAKKKDPWCHFEPGSEPGTFVCTRQGCTHQPIRTQQLPIWRECNCSSARKASKRRWPQPKRGKCAGCKEAPLPSLATQAGKLAAAAGRATLAAVTGQQVLRGADEVAACLTICHACPDRLFRSDGRCAACGCFVEKKARLATEDCPQGHW